MLKVPLTRFYTLEQVSSANSLVYSSFFFTELYILLSEHVLSIKYLTYAVGQWF